MQTFLGKPELKATLLEEIIKHRKADEIAQGSYGGDTGPWCAVGCAVQSLNVKLGKTYSTADHSVYETELGIPRLIAKLEDRIFEGLPAKEAKTFPEKFIKAVPVGADLSMVWPKFALWLLMDKKDGVIKYAKKDQTRIAIENVGKLYARVVAGEIVAITEWRAARSAAAAAAAADAYAYAYAYAATYAATYAAADADDAYAAAAAAADAYAYAAAAAYAAAYAAYAADAAAYAARKARSQHYSKMAKKLISLIKEAK